MRLFLYRSIFVISLLVSGYFAIWVTGYLESVSGKPWNFVFGVFVFIGSHLFLNGIVLNKMIFRRDLEEVTPVFHFDDDKGTIGIPGEKPEEIVWDEVVEIKIVTTGKGPWEEDFWWLFYLNRRDEPVAIPQGAKGNEKLFEVLEKKFVDADMKEIKTALGSTSDALFSVWPKGS